MNIPSQKIEEFRRIWKKEKGYEINYNEALKQATNLLELYKIIFKSSKRIKK